MKSVMKSILVLAVLALGLNSAEPVKANGGGVHGRWAGTAFQSGNAALDLSSDGIPGNTFVLTVYDSRFTTLEGVVDSSLISVGTCAPGALELKAFGTFTFRDQHGDSLYAEVPASAPNLCFDPANPNEVLAVQVTGGTGHFAGATGTGTLNIHDTVRLTFPEFIPGFGVFPVPTIIDSRGEFVLNF